MSNPVTWNPNDKTSGVVLTNNDLTTNSYGVMQVARSTDSKGVGKFYVEIKANSISQLSSTYIGISSASVPVSVNFGTTPNAICYIPDGRVFSNQLTIKTVPTYGIGDTIGFAIDYDIKRVYIYKNGVSVGDFDYNIEGQIFVFAGTGSVSPSSFTGTANFGATPFLISQTHPETWRQLVEDGYKPYDIENADWNWGGQMDKILLLSNEEIYTLDESGELTNITTNISDIGNLTKEEYEDYGFADISLITGDMLEDLLRPIKLLYYKTDVDNFTPTPKLRQEYNLNVGVRQMIIKPN